LIVGGAGAVQIAEVDVVAGSGAAGENSNKKKY
jgi:hypothetical protein